MKRQIQKERDAGQPVQGIGITFEAITPAAKPAPEAELVGQFVDVVELHVYFQCFFQELSEVGLALTDSPEFAKLSRASPTSRACRFCASFRKAKSSAD